MRCTPLLLLAAVTAAISSVSALAAPGPCTVEGIKKIAPADAIIDTVRHVTAPVAHCEVIGHSITTDPGPNQVNWSLMLPDERFGGRFYFVGQGGGAGLTVTAFSDNNGQGNPVLKQLRDGFAVSSSDTGHSGFLWDWGANDPVRRLDYGHRGAHVSTVATQAITRAYYGMTAANRLYRYHLGCSGGGRMGMMAALHHPEDYDGIVASTVAKGGGSHYFGLILQHLVQNPDGWLSPEKLAFLERKVDEKCASPDGLVRNPDSCHFDVTALQCKGSDRAQCLTAPEIATVKVVTGRFRLGSESDADSGDIPGFSIANPTSWTATLMGPTRPTNKGRENPWAPAPVPAGYFIIQSLARGMYFDNPKFDVINDLNYKDEKTLALLSERHKVWGVTTPDISAYKAAGGKLIMWAGESENAVPPGTEREYLSEVKKAVPGSDDFVELYMVPGVNHCYGGPGPQDAPERLLDAMIGWVEEGRKPGPLVLNGGVGSGPIMTPEAAAKAVEPPISRTTLICPYPQKAVFAGRPGGYPYDASTWTCK
jgi:hypothetical protein